MLGLIAAALAIASPATGVRVVAGVVTAAAVLAAPGFVVVLPNESRVLILFGRYAGILTEARLWWVNPFTILWRERISLRIRNFQPVFDMEDFEQFVTVQSATALRHLAGSYPYDDYSRDTTSSPETPPRSSTACSTSSGRVCARPASTSSKRA